MDRQQIKYRYALDGSAKIVDISNLSKEDRKDYICLGCGRALRPALGEVRQKHFKHKIVATCSPETYLHRLGVYLFQKNYQSCLQNKLPFILEIPQINICNDCHQGPCEIDPTTFKFDLTERYNQSVMEEADNFDTERFIPDILLTNAFADKMYIEIAVSHKASDKKIDSKVPIVEITLIEEADLALIDGKIISCRDWRVELINIAPKTVEINHSHCCAKYSELKRIETLNKISMKEILSAYLEALNKKTPFNIFLTRPVLCNACGSGTCQVKEESYSEDITQYFGRIKEMHHPEQNFTSLVLESEKGQKVFLEMRDAFRSMKNCDKRIKDGEKIVEFDIKSEEDLRFLKNGWKCQEKTNLHNFKPKPSNQNLGKLCVKKVNCFKIYKSGKAWAGLETLYEFQRLQSTPGFYIKLMENDGYEFFIQEVESAFQQGHAVKNCYLCRYHAGANYSYESDGAIFCKFLKHKCGSNQAAECDYYKPDAKVIGTERYHSRYSNGGW